MNPEPSLTQQCLQTFADGGDPLAGVDLPERGVEWADEPIEAVGGLEVVGYRDRFESKSGTLGTNVAGYVVADDAEVERYREEHATHELTIPPTYTRFEEFQPVISEVSISGPDYGFGVTADRLESAIRFATGGGRYSVDDLRVTLCEHLMLVEAPEGTFTVTAGSVRNKPEGFEPERRTVAGMDVPEHDETMLAGIERIVELLDEHAGMDVTEYVCRSGGSHVFRTSDGISFRTSPVALRDVQDAEPESEVLTPHEYETFWGECFEYEPTVEDLREHVGDERSFNGVCIGHSVMWHDPRLRSTLGTEQPLRCKIRSYYLSIPEDGDRVRVSDSTFRVAEFETEGDGTTDPKPITSA